MILIYKHYNCKHINLSTFMITEINYNLDVFYMYCKKTYYNLEVIGGLGKLH